MGGLSGIAAANGWLIALLGISVVFAGLASLSLILSCFSRVIDWKNAQPPKPMGPWLKSLFHRRKRKAPESKDPGEILNEGKIENEEETLHLLTANLGNPFKLPQLLELAARRGLARPHSQINRLLLIGKIVGGADGLFRWQESKDEHTAISELTEFW